jgi:hypothetical protein
VLEPNDPLGFGQQFPGFPCPDPLTDS